jgi:hypothetical protein
MPARRRREFGETALVIEPAQASEIAPIIVESSRGELVAKVFAEHYAPVHVARGAHDAA